MARRIKGVVMMIIPCAFSSKEDRLSDPLRGGLCLIGPHHAENRIAPSLSRGVSWAWWRRGGGVCRLPVGSIMVARKIMRLLLNVQKLYLCFGLY